MKKSLNLFIMVLVAITIITSSCNKEKELPTVVSSAVTDITRTSATVGGNVTNDGNADITERGVYISSFSAVPSAADIPINLGAGAGLFSTLVNNLDPNATYYYRAFATNSMGTSMGEIMSFTTDEDPIAMTTNAVSNITTNSVTSGGNITEFGYNTLLESGIVLSTSPNATVSNIKVINPSSNQNNYSLVATGLDDNTKYYLRAFATNTNGQTFYGDEKSFTTLEEASLSIIDYSDLNMTSVDINVEVIANASVITETGICFSTNNNPSISDTKVVSNVNSGTTSISLKSLNENTKYYAKLYTETEDGVLYSAKIEIWTYALMDIDGNGYHSVTIGTQVWLLENFKATRYLNGDEIPEGHTNLEWSELTTGARCYYDNDRASYEPIYGCLYNWYVVNDSRGFAPNGWHIPSDEEWTEFVNYLGGANVTGGKVKEPGTEHWKSPNTGATNSSGFTALPGGVRGNTYYGTGVYCDLYTDAAYLSATPSPTGFWIKYASYNTTYFENNYSVSNSSACNVRLIKNQN